MLHNFRNIRGKRGIQTFVRNTMKKKKNNLILRDDSKLKKSVPRRNTFFMYSHLTSYNAYQIISE